MSLRVAISSRGVGWPGSRAAALDPGSPAPHHEAQLPRANTALPSPQLRNEGEGIRTMDEVPVSIARRFAEAAQHLIPRGAERLPDAANHVDSRIGRAGLDALHVAPVDLRQARQVVLSQSALCSQAVDVFSENGA